jgi:hypothetical protein
VLWIEVESRDDGRVELHDGDGWSEKVMVMAIGSLLVAVHCNAESLLTSPIVNNRPSVGSWHVHNIYNVIVLSLDVMLPLPA